MTDLQRLCAAIVAFASEHGLPNKVTFRELCDYYNAPPPMRARRIFAAAHEPLKLDDLVVRVQLPYIVITALVPKLTTGPWESISECEILAPRPGKDRPLWDKATPADIELMKSSRPLLVALRNMLTIAQRNGNTRSSSEMVELAEARALLIKHRG